MTMNQRVLNSGTVFLSPINTVYARYFWYGSLGGTICQYYPEASFTATQGDGVYDGMERTS
jgi:hypothetical protein